MEIAKIADLSCDDALAAMWDYLDEELDAPAMDRIAVHLWLCFACHELFETEQRFLDAIALTVPELDLATLRSRVLRALTTAGTIVD